MKHDLRRAADWAATHRDVALDLLRMYLGVALFVRGILVIQNPRWLGNYMEGVDWFWPLLASHYVAMAHLGGGLLLMFGLVTRLAAGLQVPVLAGAVFLVHLREGLMAQSQSLELSVLVLFMLLVLVVFGSGRLSLDRYVFGVRVDALEKRTPATGAARSEPTASELDRERRHEPEHEPGIPDRVLRH